MKSTKNLLGLSLAVLMTSTTAAYAHTTDKPQEDAAIMQRDTVSVRAVNYNCSGKTVRVQYGFNKQGLPTYAQANLGGKSRFMPINLNRTDNTSTVFGDDNNYSLYGDVMTKKNYNKAIVSMSNPASEFLYKECMPKVAKAHRR